jgi:DNA polymerase-4
MSREHTFPTDLYDDHVLDVELQQLAMRIAADLRRERRKAGTITVKIRDADFTTRQASRTFATPNASDKVIGEAARALLRRLRERRRTGVRLLGVAASRFDKPEASHPQLSLLEPDERFQPEPQRDQPLLRAVDDINERFGVHSIRRASTVESNPSRRSTPPQGQNIS